MCIYHGWTYGNDGALVRVPGDDAYAEGFDKSAHRAAAGRRASRTIAASGSCASIRRTRRRCTTISAGAKDYIDLVIDQSPSGQMEIIAGVQEYDVAANWKLMVENSVDDYHLPSTHSTWLNFMANSGVKIEPPPKEAGLVLPTKGLAVELGNGHFTTDNVNFRGRPVAKWIPLYGEPAKAEIDDIRSELVARLGPERATRVADTNRNLVIFPNLVINDGSSVTVRTFYPRGRRQDARHRLGARPGRGERERARAPARRLPHLLRPGRLRHARRRRGARAGAAGPRQLAARTAGRKCRAAWARRASSSTATSITCASSGAAGTS